MEKDVTPSKNLWHFIWDTRKPFFIVGGLISSFFIASLFTGGWFSELWGKIDPLIGCATLILVMVVGHGEAKQDWMESLPKRLNVLFLFKNSPIMECKKAYLSSASDIRNLGQQIGNQMADVNFLEFKAPIIKSTNGEISDDESHLYYEIVFHLTDLPSPKKIISSPPPQETPSPFKAFHESCRCVTWFHPFDKIDFRSIESIPLEDSESVKKRWPAELLKIE